MMNIGFMQGRLCDLVDGKIQAFPWLQWESEFPAARAINIGLMEWTLDQERLHDNPLLMKEGRKRIRALADDNGVQILSVTGDCFMQAPFFKVTGDKRDSLLRDLDAVLAACSDLGVRYVVIPLVDNGAITNADEETALLDGLLARSDWLAQNGMKIVFESDFSAGRLADFIAQFPEDTFGINYDIGNSAALGYDFAEEISSYGSRIDNVHVKDRELHGMTVPLGTGAANFPGVFRALRECGYDGNFILQTARAEDGDHAAAIAKYRDMTLQWWEDCGP